MAAPWLLPISAISFSFLFLLLLLLPRSPSLYPTPSLSTSSSASSSCSDPRQSVPLLRVFIAHLPIELNYGLLHDYWSYRSSPDAESSFGGGPNPDQNAAFSRGPGPKTRISGQSVHVLPYPEDPLIKQYSAEYWLLGDLLTSKEGDGEGEGEGEDEQEATIDGTKKKNKKEWSSVALRVSDSSEADVIFVPFFATLSAELQLRKAKGKFRHKKENEDYERQRRVVEIVKNTTEWRRSGGRDHVFVITDPVAMWHMRSEISPAILLTVDFGGWYMEDAKDMDNHHEGPIDVIQHRQVSLLKDVIVPYTHLLPPLHLSSDRDRNTLAYFKGARHRHRTGLVRDKLWALLKDEPEVVFEEGFPNITGLEQALRGMRDAEFCLHPAGDTPTSCRLFDAIMSLCIPVIISDSIELPFEGELDYAEFSLFVAVHNALEPGFLVNYLKSIPRHQKKAMRARLAGVQHLFEYDNGYAGGLGPAKKDGAVNMIWRKVWTKVPIVKEAIVREKRKPVGAALVPLRCECL